MDDPILRKLADDEQESHKVRNTLMGAGAIAPWAGRIGQTPTLHAGIGHKAQSLAELKRMMRKGDIILTGDPDFSAIKGGIGLASGQVKNYHVGVHTGRGGVQSHPLGGVDRNHAIHPDERVHVLRPNLTSAERKQFIAGLHKHKQIADRYKTDIRSSASRGVASRYDREGAGLVSGMYENRQGLLAGIKELLKPKLHSAKSVEEFRQATLAKRKEFGRNTGGVRSRAANAVASDMENDVGKYMAKREFLEAHPRIDKTLRKVLTPDFYENHFDSFAHIAKDATPEEMRAICSTLPASYLPKPVVPGKMHNEIMPSDYLRSKNMTPIAHYNVHDNIGLHERVLSAGPTITRLGIGAGLGAAAYGGSKLYEHVKNKIRGDRQQ